MRRQAIQSFLFVGVIFGVSGVASSADQPGAVKPAEYLVPATTKGFLAVPDVGRMQEAWNRIDLGQLSADPTMKPFIEDLQAQIQSRIDRTGVRIGVTAEDLFDICTSEVAVAFIQPEAGPQKHAIVAIADVAGKGEEVADLRETVATSMAERQAKRVVKTVRGVEIETYTVPIREGARRTFKAVLFVANDRLVAADHEDVALQILRLIQGEQADVLANQEAFVKTMARCQQEAGGLRPHLKWFIEPLGYAEVAREAAAVQKPQRNDVLGALARQGFDAIRGAGGFFNMDAGDFDLLHRSFIYAPPIPEAGEERYRLAARMLAFSGQEPLDVQRWIPHTVSSFATATWRLQDAYRFIDTLVDEIAGEEGFFDDLKASLEEDPHGPQINVDQEIVAHLGDRVTVITDCETPIHPKSERFLVAISLTNPQAMADSVKKALETDPDAREVKIDGHEIWEIINEEYEAPVVSVEGGDGFTAFADFEVEEEAEEEMSPLMSNAAISIVEGQLMVSSHVDFIVELLRGAPDEPTLEASQDYQTIQHALQELGATNQDIARLFTRADEELYASYELIRTGRMPESEGLLGNVLNQLLGPQEKGVVREQAINGENMPDYQVVRRYLGTVGVFIAAEEDGWYSAGVGLSKDAPRFPTYRPALTTAERDHEAN